MAGSHLLVLSAHYDDAVLSAARVIAAHPGAVVATACTAPAPPGRLPQWDRDCGFDGDDDVMAVRRAEDDRALARLGATARPLGVLDSQYLDPEPGTDRAPGGAVPMGAAVRSAIAGTLAEHADATILLPLGIVHPDHIALRNAALDVAGTVSARFVVYEDLPYGRHGPHRDARRAAFASFIARGLLLVPTELPANADVSVKAAAVACYRSQVPLLEVVFDGQVVVATEAYWDVAGAPAASL